MAFLIKNCNCLAICVINVSLSSPEGGGSMGPFVPLLGLRTVCERRACSVTMDRVREYMFFSFCWLLPRCFEHSLCAKQWLGALFLPLESRLASLSPPCNLGRELLLCPPRAEKGSLGEGRVPPHRPSANQRQSGFEPQVGMYSS